MFDRFYRSAAAHGGPGSGLGLSIVRQVAEDHGGTVEATNTDRGAQFTLRFPPPASPAGGFRLSSSSSAVRLMEPPHPPSARSPAARDEHGGDRRMGSTTPDRPAGDPPPETPEPTSPKTPLARTWLAAGALAAVVVVVGVVLMSRGGSDDADTTTDEPSAATPRVRAGGGLGPRRVRRGDRDRRLHVDRRGGGPSESTTTLSVEASAETVITETVEGTVADLAVGDSVIVIGEETETGVAATSVVEGGGLGAGFGGGAPEREAPRPKVRHPRGSSLPPTPAACGRRRARGRRTR